MLSSFRKIILILSIWLIACQDKEYHSNEYENFLKQGNAVVVLADNNQCWNCEKYYWVLRGLVRENPELRVIWVTRKLKESEKAKLNKELDINWNDNVLHFEDTKLLRKLKESLTNVEAKVLVNCESKVQEYTGNRDVKQMAAGINGCLGK
jgi:hypothetical protein